MRYTWCLNQTHLVLSTSHFQTFSFSSGASTFGSESSSSRPFKFLRTDWSWLTTILCGGIGYDDPEVNASGKNGRNEYAAILRSIPQQRMVATRIILKWMPPQRMVVTKTVQMSRPPPRKVVTSILKSMHHRDQSIDFRSHHDHCRHLLHLRFQFCLEIMSIRTGTSTLTCSFRWFTSTIVASSYIFPCILRGRTIYDSESWRY